MKKADSQHNNALVQPATQRKGTASLESPQGEQLAQLEAMADASPQVVGLAKLAAMANDNPVATAQRQQIDGIYNSPHATVQRQQFDGHIGETAQREEAPTKPNNTGLPDNLKSGIESLSGMSMDNVRVHYNSSQPAQLNAHAYAQGTDIHVAPGQEQHLPHEAWHVVQQAQGRVQPTMQMKNDVFVNDDNSLEREADVMGAKATSVGYVQRKSFVSDPIDPSKPKLDSEADTSPEVMQLTKNFSEWRSDEEKERLTKDNIRNQVEEYWEVIDADRTRASETNEYFTCSLKDVVHGIRKINEIELALDAFAQYLTYILEEMDRIPKLDEVATEKFIDDHVEGYMHGNNANQITTRRSVNISTVINLGDTSKRAALAQELSDNKKETSYFTGGGYSVTWVDKNQDVQKKGTANVRITREENGKFINKFNHLTDEITWSEEPTESGWVR